MTLSFLGRRSPSLIFWDCEIAVGGTIIVDWNLTKRVKEGALNDRAADIYRLCTEV